MFCCDLWSSLAQTGFTPDPELKQLCCHQSEDSSHPWRGRWSTAILPGLPIFIHHHLHWALPSHLPSHLQEETWVQSKVWACIFYPGISKPRHISSSFDIYTQPRVSVLSAGKSQKTNISIFYHTQPHQYQDDVSMLRLDNLRDTQQVGKVEPKWDRRCQFAEERIWKSLWLKHNIHDWAPS